MTKTEAHCEVVNGLNDLDRRLQGLLGLVNQHDLGDRDATSLMFTASHALEEARQHIEDPFV